MLFRYATCFEGLNKFLCVFAVWSERQSCREVPCCFLKGGWDQRAISAPSNTKVKGQSPRTIYVLCVFPSTLRTNILQVHVRRDQLCVLFQTKHLT